MTSNTPCKICGGPVDDVGSVPFSQQVRDSSRSTATTHDAIDSSISYVRCTNCGFLFTRDFDGWSREDFLRHVYNDEYAIVDPDFARRRPERNARMIAKTFGADLARLKILDYGGGDGTFARTLIKEHAARLVDSHDELMAPGLRSGELYDLITCFETLEHLPDPRRAVREIRNHLQSFGAAVLSTLLQPEPYPGLDWWYVGPRCGHISLFSVRSLQLLFDSCGMAVRTSDGLVHVATRRML